MTVQGGHPQAHDYVVDISDGLADDGDLTVDPADHGVARLKIVQIVHDGDCDLKYQADPDGNDTFEIDVTIDSLTGSGISQGNEIIIDDADNEQFVLTNTNGDAQDFVVRSEVIPSAA